jgi:heme/copper-type cytochrome/quinol oxidase subunit 2
MEEDMKYGAMTALAAIAMVTASVVSIGTAKAGQPAVQNLTIYVMPDDLGLVGPDKLHHDSFIPASFVLKAGEQVQLTVINYDDVPHSITAPGLGLNLVVKPGTDVAGSDQVTPVTTTFTFTPTKKGQFRWHCMFPCDTGTGKGVAMKSSFDGQDADGFMAGYIEVI